jgi:hypothetical protein
MHLRALRFPSEKFRRFSAASFWPFVFLAFSFLSYLFLSLEWRVSSGSMYRYALDAGLRKAQLGHNKNEMYNSSILLESALLNVNVHVHILFAICPSDNAILVC